MFHPLHFIKDLISQKPFRSPPLNHIYSCSLWWDTFRDPDWGIPQGHVPPPPSHKRSNISETIQIPTPKPYIFMFLMMRRIHCANLSTLGKYAQFSGKWSLPTEHLAVRFMYFFSWLVVATSLAVPIDFDEAFQLLFSWTEEDQIVLDCLLS